MNAMHKRPSSHGTFVHCVDRAGMARTTIMKGSGIMSQRNVSPHGDHYVAELLGETPAMLKLCGRIMQLEHDQASMTHKTYRLQMRSLRTHMNVMLRLQDENAAFHAEVARVNGGQA